MENKEIQIENVLDNKERAYATGKRKNSIARVWLKRGSGEIKINGKTLNKYFLRPVLQMIVNQPLDVVKADNSYEIMASVKGGGLSGQAGAIRHGISKALSYMINQIDHLSKKLVFLQEIQELLKEKKLV